MRISVQQFKGGAGKTTICELLASALAAREVPVIAYDTDPQGSLVKWTSNASETGQASRFIDVREVLDFDDLHRDIQSELDKDSDRAIIIDTAGSAQEFQDLVAQISELIIVPTRLNAADATEAIKVFQRLDELQQSFGDTAKVANSCLAFTLTDAPSSWTREAEAYHAYLTEIPHLKTTIRRLSAFEKMQARGPLPELIRTLKSHSDARVRIQAIEYVNALVLADEFLTEVQDRVQGLRNGR